MTVCSSLYGAPPAITSKEGEGTTISFAAKLAPVAYAKGDAEVMPPEPVVLVPFDRDDPTPRRCLIIDDQKMNRRFLRAILGKVLPRSTWTIIEAESGEEALSIATKAEPIDLATIDFHMRRLNGAETATQLRALFSSTVCIGVTGNNEAGCAEVRAFHDAGCLDVWGKLPPRQEQITALLFGIAASD